MQPHKITSEVKRTLKNLVKLDAIPYLPKL